MSVWLCLYMRHVCVCSDVGAPSGLSVCFCVCTEAETRHEINSHYSIIIIELSDCFGITGVKCYKLTATRIF